MANSLEDLSTPEQRLQLFSDLMWRMSFDFEYITYLKHQFTVEKVDAHQSTIVWRAFELDQHYQENLPQLPIPDYIFEVVQYIAVQMPIDDLNQSINQLDKDKILKNAEIGVKDAEIESLPLNDPKISDEVFGAFLSNLDENKIGEELVRLSVEQSLDWDLYPERIHDFLKACQTKAAEYFKY
jgi:hypothetical protein